MCMSYGSANIHHVLPLISIEQLMFHDKNKSIKSFPLISIVGRFCCPCSIQSKVLAMDRGAWKLAIHVPES
jgi:hypothetical protein